MHYTLFIFLTFISSLSFSQNFVGIWKGEFKDSDSIIHIKFNVMIQKDSLLGAMMIEPKFCLFTDSCFQSAPIHLKSSKEKISFKGALTDNKNELNGDFEIKGKCHQVSLYRGEPIYRPQEPKKPYPYLSENIVFENKKDNVKLSGTLTIPDTLGKFSSVILISGSSPTNRDSESFHHKPFQAMADYLTRNGIAVLRYDDRGVNKSTGDFYNSTILDFAKDVSAGIDYLKSRKEINENKIGLIGHSEGGVVASIVASQNSDLGYIVLLASPGIELKEAFLLQGESMYNNGDIPKENYELNRKFHTLCYELIEKDIDSKIAFNSLLVFKDAYKELYTKSGIGNSMSLHEIMFYDMVRINLSPHNRFNIKCNPADYLEKVNCPVLSLNGSKDILVPSRVNQGAIKEALLKSGNKDFTIMELEGLNHSFQKCKTCSIMEGKDLEQTFSTDALKEIADWIQLINESDKVR